jgi:hypothetical protein
MMAIHKSVSGKVDWKIVGYTGLIVGTIFLLTTGGDPWGFSALVKPIVMGREIVPASASAGQLNFGYLALHYVLSLIFVVLMAPFLSRSLIRRAVVVGLLFGFLFYAFNRIVFAQIDIPTKNGEAKVLVTNLCFGLVAASVYRGLVRGSARNPQG